MPPPTEQDAAELMRRLDGYRGSYFMNWFIQVWTADIHSLQHRSVAELVTEYDRTRQHQN